MFGDGDQAQGAGTSSGEGSTAGTTVEAKVTVPVETSSTDATKNTGIPQDQPADDAAWDGMPKWIRDLRRENASQRTKRQETESKLATIQGELDAYKAKDMTELEKANAEKTRLEEKLAKQERETRDLQVEVAATQLGIVDPEAAAKLMDWSAVEAGKSVKDALKDLVEAKPWLKKAEADSSSSTSSKTPVKPEDSKTSATTPNGTGEGSLKTYKRSEIAKLASEDPDAFNKLFEEGGLAEAMKAGRVINDT